MTLRIGGTYVNFKDGDKLTWQGRLLATVIHEQRDECDWWHIRCEDGCGRDVFIGYANELTQNQIDDCVNTFWSGLTIALTFNEKIETAAQKTLPIDMSKVNA